MRAIFLFTAASLFALGQAYTETSEEAENFAPWQEIFVSDSILLREYSVGQFERLVLVGDMKVTLTEGTAQSLTIRGNRALMSQVGVRKWNVELTISVDSGLFGPRERGRLEVYLTLGSASSIEAREGVSLQGRIAAGSDVNLAIRSGSSAELSLSAPTVNLAVTWNSRVTLEGIADSTHLAAKDPTRVDLSGFKTGILLLDARDGAEVLLGTTGSISGRLGRGAVLRVENPKALPGLHEGLRVEGSVLDRR